MTGYQVTYLDTEPFHERYKAAARFLDGRTAGKTVLDINCGTPGFCLYVPWGRYIGNDAYTPDDLRGIEFINCKDDEVDIPADVLCLFGGGGYRLTGNELESKTDLDSLVRLAGYEPEFVIFESAQAVTDIVLANLDGMLEGYYLAYLERLTVEPGEHYHDHRQLNIFERE